MIPTVPVIEIVHGRRPSVVLVRGELEALRVAEKLAMRNIGECPEKAEFLAKVRQHLSANEQYRGRYFTVYVGRIEELPSFDLSCEEAP